MRENSLGQAYHTERAVAVRQGIDRYPCGCEKCHGFTTQVIHTVQSHHRKYERDRILQEPLLRFDRQHDEVHDDDPVNPERISYKNEYMDAHDFEDFEGAPANTEANLEDMAQNYFARVDKIHINIPEEDDSLLDFDDVFSDIEESDDTVLLEQLLQQAEEPHTKVPILAGPHSPSKHTIDVFMQPLEHELKKLWAGVPVVDMSEPPGASRRFIMSDILMWTINDFPAYTLISSQTGKGYAGCPVCGENTVAKHSQAADKTVYLGHRRWLKSTHRWKEVKAAFNGHQNHETAPPKQSGLTVVQRGACRLSFLQCGGSAEDDPLKRTRVKRISIFFELPYWQDSHFVTPLIQCTVKKI